MITDFLMTMGVLLVQFFSNLMTLIVLEPSTSIEFGSYMGYVFGNIMLLNDFLPVTEALILAGIALSLKFSLLVYQVVMFFFTLFKYVRATFVSFRP